MKMEDAMLNELNQAAALSKGGSGELPELDIAVMRRLYAFGGLLVYRVTYFDPVLFQIKSGKATFSEESAKKEMDGLRRSGFNSTLESFMVKFDGAFMVRCI